LYRLENNGFQLSKNGGGKGRILAGAVVAFATAAEMHSGPTPQQRNLRLLCGILTEIAIKKDKKN